MGAPAANTTARATFVWAIVFLLITLPFTPFWPDFEQARRGIAMLLAVPILLALAARRGGADPGRWASRAWLGLIAAHGASWLWATNGGEAIQRTTWLLTLGAVGLAAARSVDARAVLRAFLPTGLVVATFGLLQASGIEWPAGYGSMSEPISTLGNRNAASEVVALAVAAAALIFVRRDATPLPAVVVALGATYLWVNQSRSGLVAAALTVLPLALTPWRHHAAVRRAALVGLALLGLAAGEGIRRLPLAMPISVGTAPTPARPAMTMATLEVRMEMWASSFAMWKDASLFGHGAGQWKVEYPRYRSEREIELSTLGRQDAVAPRTAHDDPVEIAVETGTVGLALFLAFWLAVLMPHHRGGWARTLPLVAFFLLGLVRAPLGNAPAAVFAFAYAGALCTSQGSVGGSAPAWPRTLRLLLAIPIATLIGWLGLGQLLGQHHAAVHAEAQSRPPAERRTLEQMHALDRAVAWLPWDSQMRALRTRLRFALAHARKDQAALRELLAPGGDVDRLLRLAPHSTANLLTSAEVASAGGEVSRASAWLTRILELDPPNPEARLFLATILVAQGDAPRAIEMLYAEGRPHPRLLADLPRHFVDLAATTTGPASDLLQGEAEFFAAFLALRSHPEAEETAQLLARLATGQTTRGRRDLRPAILIASRLLSLGDRPAVEAAAERLPRQVPLTAPQRVLLSEFLAPLRAFPGWSAALGG